MKTELMDEVYTIQNLSADRRQKGNVELKARASHAKRHSLSGLVILMAAFVLGSLLCLENNFHASMVSFAEEFKWMVLVNGSPVEIDDVGRALKQLDAGNDVRFVSSQVIADKLNQDPMLSREITPESTSLFPPSWEVSWSTVNLDYDKQSLLLSEVRRLPGVIDIAYDQHLLDLAHRFKSQWLLAKMALSAVLFLTVVALFILGGRALFFFGTQWPSLMDFTIQMSQDFLWWGAGILLIGAALGTPRWEWALGGVVAGIFHFFLRASEATK